MQHGKGWHNWILWSYAYTCLLWESRGHGGTGRMLCCRAQGTGLPREHWHKDRVPPVVCACWEYTCSSRLGATYSVVPGTCAYRWGSFPFLLCPKTWNGRQKRKECWVPSSAFPILTVVGGLLPIDGGILPWRQHQGSPLSMRFISQPWQKMAKR